MNQVTCKMKRMGGGFGGKETRAVFSAAAIAVAAQHLQKPVKITLDRHIDMATTGQRHAFKARYTASADKATGKLVAMDVQLYSNGGSGLDLSGPVMDRALLHVDGCYHWPHFRAKGIVCKTNQPPHTAFRGFGGPQGIVVVETVMDHLASAMDADPATLRADNFYRPGDIITFGTAWDTDKNIFNVPAVWKQVLNKANVPARKAEVAAFNAANKHRKRGLALVPTKFGINFTAKFMNQGGALVHVYTDGTVYVSHGGTEMGQGLHTKIAQIAAHAFGIPVEDVVIGSSDTDKVANGMPTAASMSNDLYGMATLDACKQILARLEPVAASMVGKSFKDIVISAYFQRVDLSAHGFYKVSDERCGFDWDAPAPAGWTPTEGQNQMSFRGHPFNYFTQGVACTEVEVDCLTGDHRILRTDCVVDLGASVNPAIDIGQVEGAFVQGMGWATTEEIMWGDSEHPWIRPAGRLHTAGPGTYKVPSFNDTPEQFNVSLFEHVQNRVCVHSSKAVGEPPFFLGASVVFAIRDALTSARKDNGISGFWQLNSPVTSERIRMAVGDNIAGACIDAVNGAGSENSATFQTLGSF
jgi:xanthine dehydrogenase/oxidase